MSLTWTSSGFPNLFACADCTRDSLRSKCLRLGTTLYQDRENSICRNVYRQDAFDFYSADLMFLTYWPVDSVLGKHAVMAWNIIFGLPNKYRGYRTIILEGNLPCLLFIRWTDWSRPRGQLFLSSSD